MVTNRCSPSAQLTPGLASKQGSAGTLVSTAISTLRRCWSMRAAPTITHCEVRTVGSATRQARSQWLPLPPLDLVDDRVDDDLVQADCGCCTRQPGDEDNQGSV